MNSPSEPFERFETESEQLCFAVPDIPGRSYERAKESGVVVRPLGAFHYSVSLTDCDIDKRHEHVAEYYLDDLDGETVRFGRCSCKGWRYHSGECAHLWGLRFAERHGTVEPEQADDALDDVPTCPVCGASHPEVIES